MACQGFLLFTIFLVVLECLNGVYQFNNVNKWRLCNPTKANGSAIYKSRVAASLKGAQPQSGGVSMARSGRSFDNAFLERLRGIALLDALSRLDLYWTRSRLSASEERQYEAALRERWIECRRAATCGSEVVRLQSGHWWRWLHRFGDASVMS